MKHKDPNKPETVYYDCEVYDYDPIPPQVSTEDLYQIFGLSDDNDTELEGVADLMREPEGFAQKEVRRKKSRFFLCNIV